MLKYTITQKNKARGDKTWYGRIFDTATKQLRFVSLATELKRVAEDWKRARIAESMTGKKDTSHITIDKAAADFLGTHEGKSTFANYRILLDHIKVYCSDNSIARFEDLSPTSCVGFFSSLSRLRASTRRRMLTMSKTWYKWCCRAYEIRGIDNPFGIVKVEKPTPPDRSFWTPEQIAAILDVMKPEDRLVCAFMGYEGLRIHEAVKVKGSDIRDGKLFVLGKGKKLASIPIGEKMKAELERFGKLPSDYIFKSRNPASWVSRLKYLFSFHPELDFGGKVHPHRFRHSFASNLIRAGVNIKAVQLLMRHENVNITLNTYAHLIPSDLDEAINHI